jgi:hypothetical protein
MEPLKHLNTVINALASTPQKTLNVEKRRYLRRHPKKKPGNGAP